MDDSSTCSYPAGIANMTSHWLLVNDISVISLNILIMIGSIVINAFLVRQFLKTRQPVSNTLLFLLAALDVVKGIFVHPLFIATKILELYGIFNCVIQNVSNIMLAIFSGYSVVIATTLLATERFIAVLYPIFYRTRFTKRHILVTAIVVFVIWVVYVVCWLVIWYDGFTSSLMFVITSAICLVYCVPLYIKIYYTVQKSANLNGKTSANSKATNTNKSQDYLTNARKEREDNISVKNWVMEEKTKTTVDTKDNTKNNSENQVTIFMKDITSSWQEDESSKNSELACSGSSEIDTQSGPGCFSNILNGNVEMPSSYEVRCQAVEECGRESPRTRCDKTISACKKSREALKKLTICPKEKKTINRILCIISALYICYFPQFYFLLHLIISKDMFVFVKYIFPWCTTIGFLSAIINPFIYCYKNDSFWGRDRNKKPSVESGL